MTQPSPAGAAPVGDDTQLGQALLATLQVRADDTAERHPHLVVEVRRGGQPYNHSVAVEQSSAPVI